MESELLQLSESLESSEASAEAIESGIRYLKALKSGRGRLESCHSALCVGMLAGIKSGGSKTASDLLNCCGTKAALRVVYSCIGQSELSAALWLSTEVQALLTSGRLTALFRDELSPAPLSADLEQLVGVVCRLPDTLSNRLGRQLSPSLLPPQYFKMVGLSIADCLKDVAATSKCESVVFLSALTGTASVLGQKEPVLGPLLSLLVDHVTRDPVWGRVSQSLFSHLPAAGLEGALETIVSTTPSSLRPSLLHSMLGDLVLINQRAKFILTHKLVLVRVPSSPNAVYNLIGYLWSCDMLGETLKLALGVWSDSSALRHMADRQHLWISSVLMLGINCFKESDKFEEFKPKLQRLTMVGMEAHIASPVEGLRRTGMAVGQFIMNTLRPMEIDKQLQFEYEATADVKTLLELSRPVTEIQEGLEKLREERSDICEGGGGRDICEGSGGRDVCEGSGGCEGGGERYGGGMVKTVDCSDSDSDDDLKPYDMSDDPVSNVPRPPQYLRTLIQGLLSTKDPLKMESSLKAAEELIRKEPSDLSEVCVELTKILLHLSDLYALPNFVSTRLNSLVSLSVSRPRLVAPFLTTEFYGPNYNLRQRMDLLEVIATSALELSQPRPPSSSGRGTVRPPVRKAWEEVIQERLKAKTRIISKGRVKTPPTATPNRFADVAPLFFFPLMSSYDCPQGTLDLLGQDSLLLGNLLYTLGTVMYAASNTPISPAMGVALLDFTWALRYHSAVYVRQGVLYSLAMLVSATPTHSLRSHMEGGLGEALQWTIGVASDDADVQCRTLASHVLSLSQTKLKEV